MSGRTDTVFTSKSGRILPEVYWYHQIQFTYIVGSRSTIVWFYPNFGMVALRTTNLTILKDNFKNKDTSKNEDELRNGGKNEGNKLGLSWAKLI